jgi:crotonobetainyl-CoA:carnitine CoA-transferase CaiB-like acyl-CoA transferase
LQDAGTFLRHQCSSPLLGQHTADVLRELGLDEREIERLEESGVIVRAERPATT